jgi:hypothetical protein
MTPPRGKGDAEQYGMAMSDVVATGIVAFARPRAGNPADKSLAWRGYSSRLIEALRSWEPLFDPAFTPPFNAFKPGGFLKTFVPAPVQGVAAEAERRVLAPMDGQLTKVDIQGLIEYRDNQLRGSKSWTLAPFRDQPSLVLPRGN